MWFSLPTTITETDLTGHWIRTRQTRAPSNHPTTATSSNCHGWADCITATPAKLLEGASPDERRALGSSVNCPFGSRMIFGQSPHGGKLVFQVEVHSLVTTDDPAISRIGSNPAAIEFSLPTAIAGRTSLDPRWSSRYPLS